MMENFWHAARYVFFFFMGKFISDNLFVSNNDCFPDNLAWVLAKITVILVTNWSFLRNVSFLFKIGLFDYLEWDTIVDSSTGFMYSWKYCKATQEKSLERSFSNKNISSAVSKLYSATEMSELLLCVNLYYKFGAREAFKWNPILNKLEYIVHYC